MLLTHVTKIWTRQGSQGQKESTTGPSPKHSLFISLVASLVPSTLFCCMRLEPGLLLGPKLTCLSFPTEKEPLPLTSVSIPKLPGQVSDWPNLSHMVTAGLEGAGCPDHMVGAGGAVHPKKWVKSREGRITAVPSGQQDAQESGVREDYVGSSMRAHSPPQNTQVQ